jgi:membrane protein required for colicin V production
MLWVDNAIIALMFIYIVYGFIRGLSQEIFALFAWLFGIMVAWFFSQNFSVFLVQYFPEQSSRFAASFTALMLLTLFVGGIVRILLGAAVKKSRLTILERLGGSIMGIVHAFLVITAFIIISGLTSLPKENWWFKSKFIPPFQMLASFGKSVSTNTLAAAIKYPKQP